MFATLSDWLKRLAPVFQPMRRKTKTIAPCTRDLSRASGEFQVIARNCDWFMELFVPVVIGWFWFENRSICTFHVLFCFLNIIIFMTGPTSHCNDLTSFIYIIGLQYYKSYKLQCKQ